MLEHAIAVRTVAFLSLISTIFARPWSLKCVNEDMEFLLEVISIEYIKFNRDKKNCKYEVRNDGRKTNSNSSC